MASRISQMRNATQQPQIPPSQEQLNKSIDQVKGLMNNLQNFPNPEQALINVLQNNPQTIQLAQLYRTNNLEQVAKLMAQMNGININDVISQLLH